MSKMGPDMTIGWVVTLCNLNNMFAMTIYPLRRKFYATRCLLMLHRTLSSQKKSRVWLHVPYLLYVCSEAQA